MIGFLIGALCGVAGTVLIALLISSAPLEEDEADQWEMDQ